MAANTEYMFALLFYIISVAIWGFAGTLRVIILFIKSPVHFFHQSDRSEVPKMARDPDLGLHDSVILAKSKLKITYVANGKKGKPLMLCVHGFPECWYSWRFQLKEFSEKYWVVAINLPGYSDSDKPSDLASYKVASLIDNIAEVVQALGYDKATMVAHDWGGALIWAYATLYSSMCEKVVIMNCPNTVAFQKGFGVKQYLCSWYMFFFQLPWLPEILLGCCDFMLLDESFRGDKMGVRNKENMTEEDVEVYKHALQSWESRRCALNYYRANNMLARYGTQTQRSAKLPSMSSLTAPVLLIWGTEDQALTIELAAHCARSSKMVSVEYVDGASHWVQQDNPAEVNRLMWKFLN